MDREIRTWPIRRDHASTKPTTPMSEGERLTRILKGLPLEDVKPWFLNRLDEREVLEFLATFSSDHARKLSELRAQEAEQARSRDTSHRERTTGDSWTSEWNEADHPRTGSAPNPGWFASKGGGAADGGSHATSSAGTFNARTERSKTKIELAAGKNWNGGNVLHVLRAVAPDLVPFFQEHATLARTSPDERGATTTVRSGEAGPEVKGLSDATANELGRLIAHFHIPDDWNDLQVAQYLLTQLADHPDVFRMVARWAIDKPTAFGDARERRFRQGLKTAAKLAEGYYKALAGLAPGGNAAVVAWDIQNGDHLGAALGAAFMLPFGKIAQAGLESGGTIALREGEKLIAVVPVSVIKRLKKMPKDQQAYLERQLLGTKTREEAAAIIEKFFGTAFHRHHPLPKFLGGDTKQLLSTIPKSVHDEFHAELRRELRASGFTIPFGSAKGSGEAWRTYFQKNPGAQGKAFDAVLSAGRRLDEKHGTEITSAVWKNLVDQNVMFFP